MDDDGYQKGKKRYPIDRDDLVEMEAHYRDLTRDRKAGFVTKKQMKDDGYWTLASEAYLRAFEPHDLDADRFEDVVGKLEAIFGIETNDDIAA